MKFYSFLISTLLFSFGSRAQVMVLTQHNDLKRTGWNNNEHFLTQSTVKPDLFGKIFTRAVDDQIYAQPLVAGIDMNGGLYNVVIVATVNNSVYAFDADDASASQPFWHVNLTYPGYRPPRNTDFEQDACRNFIGNIGIVSTPVIDMDTKTIYVVARSVSQDGQHFVQFLHALDLNTGSEKLHSPVLLTATVSSYSEGSVNGLLTFDPKKHNQRAGLLLYKDIVYICWASHCDVAPYHGWLMGYNAKTLEQKYVYDVTRRSGLGGGIWMSGQAPAVDDEGYIYVTTGNGTVGAWDHSNPNDTTNRAESIIKLWADTNRMAVADFFTPANWSYLETWDLDYGVDGVLLIPGTHLSLSGSKEGYSYLINNDDMGHISENDSKALQKLNINVEPQSGPNHLHGSPVYFKNENGQEYIYAWAESGLLKQFPFNRSRMRFDTAHVILGTTQLSEGMPGSMLAVSSNNSQKGTGIIWASHPTSGNSIDEIVPGMLQAFDANNVQHELWNSNMNAPRDSIGRFAKFVCPTVANGKVYMATFSNQLAVYGLLTNPERPSGEFAITAYPNPAANRLYIQCVSKTSNEKISVRMVSSLGYMVLNFTASIPSVSQTLVADLPPNIRSGFYILIATNSEGESRNSKVIIQR